MDIVMATSEAVPYSKTGGLADVTSALCKELSQMGHRVWLFVPYYPQIYRARKAPVLHDTGSTLEIRVGGKVQTCGVYWSYLPGTKVTVFHIHHPYYFDRPALYNDRNGDYTDNCERFTFFCRSVLEVCREKVIHPEILHVNDWQTGLLPALLKVEYRSQPGFQHTASIITIHNMAFQGRFWHWDMQLTGLDWKYYNFEQMEAWGQLNLLKTGVVFSEKVTTVSPTYAQEIQTIENGYGLHDTLRSRREDLIGILNGVDMSEWNPAVDPHIATNYDIHSFEAGKAACKAALQRSCGLPERPDVPLFGMVSRMTGQKGLDLLDGIFPRLMELDLQMVFLGTGEPHYENRLLELKRDYPQKVSTTVGFNEPLAHQIEAGSDLYLMPSQFEPCGLNQMYSMIYGTIPIVHAVGGLADTVISAGKKGDPPQDATGLSFHKYQPETLLKRVNRGMELYHNKPVWTQLVRNAMQRDFSWKTSAKNYLEVYQQALASLKGEHADSRETNPGRNGK